MARMRRIHYQTVSIVRTCFCSDTCSSCLQTQANPVSRPARWIILCWLGLSVALAGARAAEQVFRYDQTRSVAGTTEIRGVLPAGEQTYKPAAYDAGKGGWVVVADSFAAYRAAKKAASAGSQTPQADTEAHSGQKIVDLAVSMQGCYADEVGTNVAVWPFPLARHLRKQGPGPHDYEAWCSEFVCWAYAAAGWPLARGPRGVWMLKNTTQLRAWFLQNRRFVTRNSPDWASLAPQPGDYVRFNNAAGGHSAMVRSVAGPDLNIVHGNSGNRVRLSTVKDFRSNTNIDGIGLRLGP
jgi:hypothetical protein